MIFFVETPNPKFFGDEQNCSQHVRVGSVFGNEVRVSVGVGDETMNIYSGEGGGDGSG